MSGTMPLGRCRCYQSLVVHDRHCYYSVPVFSPPNRPPSSSGSLCQETSFLIAACDEHRSSSDLYPILALPTSSMPQTEPRGTFPYILVLQPPTIPSPFHHRQNSPLVFLFPAARRILSVPFPSHPLPQCPLWGSSAVTDLPLSWACHLAPSPQLPS